MTGAEGAFSPPPVALREHIAGSQELPCHTTMCSPTEKKRSPSMANRYGKGLIGCAVVIALLALLVHWADLWSTKQEKA